MYTKCSPVAVVAGPHAVPGVKRARLAVTFSAMISEQGL